MKIKTIKVGYLETNCYILSNDDKALVIDPGDEAFKIISFLNVNNLSLEGILLTHHHDDHIGGLKELLEYKEVKIFDDSYDEKNYKIANFKFEIIKTPGHTKDSITFYFKEENVMFVGDFIFYHSIGRTDLKGGSMPLMKDSIKKIKTYSDKTIIYPGHGIATVLGDEKIDNEFFK